MVCQAANTHLSQIELKAFGDFFFILLPTVLVLPIKKKKKVFTIINTFFHEERNAAFCKDDNFPTPYPCFSGPVSFSLLRGKMNSLYV